MSRLRYRHRSITSRQLDTLCTIRYIIKNLGVSQPGSVQADEHDTEGKAELRGSARPACITQVSVPVEL